jgi:predicted transcriptional regulator
MFAKSRTAALPNIGKKWTELEEQQLLNEIEIRMDYSEIARNHGRTEGGIRSHKNEMVYRLYQDNKPKEDIMKMFQITDEEFNYTISCKSTKHENRQKQKEESTPVLMIAPPLQTEFTIVKTELAELKTEVLALKKMIKHISTLMESVYEFESA